MAKAKCEQRDGSWWLPGTDIKVLEALAPLIVPLDEVKPRTRNPRITKDLEGLMEGIRRFGFRIPIVVNREDNTIEAGHKRYEAMVALGAEHIPVVWAQDDQITADGFTLSDNRTAEKTAKWDDDVLQAILRDLASEDALVGVGFDEKDIKPPKDDADNLGDIVDLDKLLEEVAFNDVVRDPVWIVVRAPAGKREKIETAMQRLVEDEEIKVERSYGEAKS